MTTFDIIVAADLRWGIGKSGAMPWPKLKGDLIHFKHTTIGSGNNLIVMGRKTWESREISSKPLPKRFNLILTKKDPLIGDNYAYVNTMDDVMDIGSAFEHVYLIGGAEIIRSALIDRRLRYIYLTRIYDNYDCDTFIPDLSSMPIDSWQNNLDYDADGISYTIRRLRVC